MKIWFFLFLGLLGCGVAQSQRSVTDSLWALLSKQKHDTDKAKTLYLLSYYYKNNKPDSALLLAQSAYNLSIKAGFEKGEATSLGLMGGAFNRLGAFSKALEYYLRQLKFVEKKADPEDLASVYISIATVYDSQKETSNALKYAYAADSIANAMNLKSLSVYTTLDIGDIYTNAEQLDSAAVYTDRCYRKALEQKNNLVIGTALNNLGNIYFKRGDYAKAKTYYKWSHK